MNNNNTTEIKPTREISISPTENNFYFLKGLRIVTPKKQERYLRVMKR